MPIKVERTTNSTTGKPLLKIEIDNGDLGGFDDALAKWTFRNEESMLRFAIAVLLNSPNKKIYVDDGGNKKTTLEPIDSLLAAAEVKSNVDETESK